MRSGARRRVSTGERVEEVVQLILDTIERVQLRVIIAGKLAGTGFGGVNPGPDAGATSIWIVGHSFIKWAKRQVRQTNIGGNLGLDRERYQVRWEGKGSMKWQELLLVLQKIAIRGSSPDLLLIHLGENYLVP
ncbi:hypothetical protein NDU88_002281 [Pleurodeles waltl]|uniref:Uncharacterized protein n=1 Tax=Pleurodeles waltl TaxID=8319 RepID=A0AAV7ND76_PLEWA|nr:hypothetical protein NDU88_002281 [Pleurodeles waltl]